MVSAKARTPLPASMLTGMSIAPPDMTDAPAAMLRPQSRIEVAVGVGDNYGVTVGVGDWMAVPVGVTESIGRRGGGLRRVRVVRGVGLGTGVSASKVGLGVGDNDCVTVGVGSAVRVSVGGMVLVCVGLLIGITV